MASEQFSLCWDNFHKNMSTGMNSLLESEDLVDVTLAVEGKFLKAHKMVLSVCSPYFKELFKSNPCQHPIVFMKDVSYMAISDLLQFMYQGEVQVSQDNLTTFIKTAEALQIKGLTGDGNGSVDTDSESVQEKPISRQIEEFKPSPVRPKKQVPAPVVTTTPAAKRPRLSLSSNDSHSAPAAPVTKTEPVSDPVQFKVEPYDQNQSVTIPDDGDENFGDDTMDDNTADDTEDYSMMEGEEPQAGTSADGTGEGQVSATSTPLPSLQDALQSSSSDIELESSKKSMIPDVNDYVVVKLLAQKSVKHYVAIILSKSDDEMVAKFMRKALGKKFTFPSVDDIANIELHEIAEILKQPSINNRQQYTFTFDISKYKNMN